MGTTLIPILFALLIVSGCTTFAPQYSSSFENTQALERKGGSGVSIEPFEAANDEVNNLSVRGPFLAPTEESYVLYLQKAVEQELYDAKRLDPNSEVKIGGVLLENEIDAGISIGTAHMKVEFVVRDPDRERYRETHSADIQWPSSYFGNVAIPMAVKEYPRVVQDLLRSLFSDPEFHNALE